MDKFEKSLKRDAQAIHADVSPELRARIDASLRGIEPLRAAPEKRHSTASLWWASSLTGLAAVLVLVVVVNINRNASDMTVEQGEQLVDVTATEPPLPQDMALISPRLDIRSAEFTSPLEEELQRLREDLEKARESVREDVDFTF